MNNIDVYMLEDIIRCLNITDRIKYEMACGEHSKKIKEQILQQVFPIGEISLSEGAQGGVIECVSYYLDNYTGCDTDDMLFYACLGGNHNVIDRVLENFCGITYLQYGLDGACFGGHMDVVMRMLELGATMQDEVLYYACLGNNEEVIRFVISSGIRNWNYGLEGACRLGDPKIIQYMIDKGANNWNFGLRGAIRGSNKIVMQDMIERGATEIN